jgi:3-methyladenine DNA glycosylase AlkD
VDVAAAVARLDRELAAAGRPERAEQERRYLKSTRVHYGVTVSVIDRLTKTWLAGLGELDHDTLTRLVAAIWESDVHERRMAAADVAVQRQGWMVPADITLVEHMLRTSGTWALVDELATHCAGPLLDRSPEADSVLDRWARDADFWIRRSALLAHLLALRQGEGDWDRFTRYADAMLEEKEFFIRKAIGWILRDTSRKRPDLVYAWILPRAHRASGVTVREAVKRLAPEQAAAVMARYER